MQETVSCDYKVMVKKKEMEFVWNLYTLLNYAIDVVSFNKV